ncbi:polyprenyl synthetase family protein [Streptomyces oryzae]|uniref:Polyprenyl synthetase family protein n=1 Tax=Streptomyces oryzae TaxID=1434886 RepID=A0ABS3XEU5_9ACTN|nr:polyprenyl synthetase family protein [Streptomyces oryzae]MBO8193920.1 polyprenyl synthetase family protein [Streptomyces oryzae]
MEQTPALLVAESPLDGRPTRIQEQLQDDLKQVRERLRTLVTPPHPLVAGPVTHAVEHTGRLLRPTLVLLSSYLLQEERDKEQDEERDEGRDAARHRGVIDAAAVVEILHTATLYHDDLIDEAAERRGGPTANAKYGATLALLTGDYLLARCMQAAASLEIPCALPVAETLVEVCVGQMLESSRLHDPLRTEEDYLSAVSGKTARLMRTATMLGALQCGASQNAQEALESFGHNLGMAFQIWDDILDICGADTGKPAAQDLVNGVYTLPVIYAVKDFPDRVLPLLREQPLSPGSCREIVSVLHESGAIGRAAQVAQQHVADALRAVESHPAFARRAESVGRQLRGLIDSLLAQHSALKAPPDSARSRHQPGDVTTGDRSTETLIRDWLDEYICQPHEHLGRTGAVCPFAAPSLRAGSLEIRTRRAGPAPGVAGVTELIRQALDEFDLIAWKGSNPALRSLVVGIPDLAAHECRLLDEAHRAVKSSAVRRGMMVGQLHPLCADPSARNPGFPVNRSPVPLVAIRRMALHDVLFLTDRKEWFEEYHRRFGHHYKPGRDALDPLFVEKFQRACAEYGVGA